MHFREVSVSAVRACESRRFTINADVSVAVGRLINSVNEKLKFARLGSIFERTISPAQCTSRRGRSDPVHNALRSEIDGMRPIGREQGTDGSETWKGRTVAWQLSR